MGPLEKGLPGGRENGRMGLFPVTKAEDPQPRHAGLLLEGDGHIDEPQIPGAETLLTDHQIMAQVRGRLGLVLDDEPVFPIQAPLQLPLGLPIRLVNVPGLGAGTDGTGTGGVDMVVGEIHLDCVHVIHITQVDA